MTGDGAGGVVERLAARAVRAGYGTIGAWVVLVALVLPTTDAWPHALTMVFAAGALGLVALAELAVEAVVRTLASYSPWKPASSPGPRDLGTIARSWLVVVGVTAAVALALRPDLVDAWLPDHFTRRRPIVLCVRLGIGSAVGFVGVFGWRWIVQRRRAAAPPWLLAVHYLGLRIVFHAAVWRVFDPHWWMLDLLGLVVLAPSIAVLVPERPGPGLRRGFATAGIALVATSLVILLGYGRYAAPRAELRTAYPGPADLMRFVQRRFDLDGDGFAAAFGGLDCDDSDPAVSPGALEIVGNGIDDNCFGGDLVGPVELPGPPRRAPGRARSVVLVTIDALRADHLDAQTMPRLFAFAEQGARFTRAYAQASFTDNSLRSLMTGRYPMDFDGVTQFFGQEESVAELLARAGYATHAIQVNEWLTPYAFQGFAAVDASLAPRNEAHDAVTSSETIDLALAAFDRLSASDAPFLLWVHLFDPHADYQPHPEAPWPAEPDDDAALYRQEVWFTDRQLGRLLERLVDSGFARDDLVVVTADHGELLGEHGVTGHALWLHEPALRVPLVLRGADVPAGEWSTRVRLVDVHPTLLELAAGIVADADGRSLAEPWRDPSAADRDTYARTTYGGEYQRAAWRGDHKLTQDLVGGTEALFDLAADAGELDNRIDAEPDTASVLRDALGSRWDRSVNDVVLSRKQARLPSRQVDPQVWARFQRGVLARECGLGHPDACAELRALDP